METIQTLTTLPSIELSFTQTPDSGAADPQSPRTLDISLRASLFVVDAHHPPTHHHGGFYSAQEEAERRCAKAG